jgi:hypothetical protein
MKLQAFATMVTHRTDINVVAKLIWTIVVHKL